LKQKVKRGEKTGESAKVPTRDVQFPGKNREEGNVPCETQERNTSRRKRSVEEISISPSIRLRTQEEWHLIKGKTDHDRGALTIGMIFGAE